jgi:DNA mismatch repair protein MutS2
VGDTVQLKEANLQGTVISISEQRGQVEVQAGQIKITVSLDSVEKATRSHTEGTLESPLIKRQLAKNQVTNELNLRGKRANEIEPALDSYINDAFLATLSQVRIIHGVGTGTVRKIVRDLLDSHPLVKSFRPGGRGEGGDGVTVVQL